MGLVTWPTLELVLDLVRANLAAPPAELEHVPVVCIALPSLGPFLAPRVLVDAPELVDGFFVVG